MQNTMILSAQRGLGHVGLADSLGVHVYVDTTQMVYRSLTAQHHILRWAFILEYPTAIGPSL